MQNLNNIWQENSEFSDFEKKIGNLRCFASPIYHKKAGFISTLFDHVIKKSELV